MSHEKPPDTPTETMKCKLNLPQMHVRQKVEPVKAFFSAVENPQPPPSTKTAQPLRSRLQLNNGHGSSHTYFPLGCPQK